MPAAVVAERMARGFGKRVLLVDRRPHIGGNAYDCKDDNGLLIHKYGPHIFHTNSAKSSTSFHNSHSGGPTNIAFLPASTESWFRFPSISTP